MLPLRLVCYYPVKQVLPSIRVSQSVVGSKIVPLLSKLPVETLVFPL